MDALAFARRGALVFGRATRGSSGGHGEHPCAALVTFHDSPGDASLGNVISAVTDDGFMHALDDELPGVVFRSADKVADRFGVEP